MSNREAMEAILQAVRSLSQLAHDSLNEQLKLGRPAKEVEILRDQVNAKSDLIVRKIREATD